MDQASNKVLEWLLENVAWTLVLLLGKWVVDAWRRWRTQPTGGVHHEITLKDSVALGDLGSGESGRGHMHGRYETASPVRAIQKITLGIVTEHDTALPLRTPMTRKIGKVTDTSIALPVRVLGSAQP